MKLRCGQVAHKKDLFGAYREEEHFSAVGTEEETESCLAGMAEFDFQAFNSMLNDALCCKKCSLIRPAVL